VARLADLAGDGQKRVAEALGVPLDGLPVVPAPAAVTLRNSSDD